MRRRGVCVALAVACGLPWGMLALHARHSTSVPLSGEWMFAASAATTREGVRRWLAAQGFAIDKRDDSVGALATRARKYSEAEASLVPFELLGLAQGHRPERVEVHVHVAPDLEPARVAIGVVIDVKGPGGVEHKGRSVSWRVPRHAGLEADVAQRLAAAIGVAYEPLAGSAAERAEQARRLLPAGVPGGCGVRVPPERGPDRHVHRAPKRASFARDPQYPGGAASGVGATVRVRAELTEHGTLAHLQVAGLGREEFDSLAAGAISLWRFSPAVVDGCPAPVAFEGGARFTPSR